MNADRRKSLKAFAVELGLYAVLVSGYFAVTLHYLGGWLKDIYDHRRLLYAVVALALMLAQGVLLEMLTTWLLGVIRKRIH